MGNNILKKQEDANTSPEPGTAPRGNTTTGSSVHKIINGKQWDRNTHKAEPNMGQLTHLPQNQRTAKTSKKNPEGIPIKRTHRKGTQKIHQHRRISRRNNKQQ